MYLYSERAGFTLSLPVWKTDFLIFLSPKSQQSPLGHLLVITQGIANEVAKFNSEKLW